jgi:MFS family permease
LFLTDVWGYSELEAGLGMTPGAVFSATVGIAIGRAARKPSPRVLVVAGGLIIAATSLALALWVPESPHYLTAWMPAALGLGLGMGAVSVGVSSAAALSVGPQRFAAATGLNIAARQVGGALGVAVLAVMLDGRLGIQPFRDVYWMMTAACVGAAVAGLRLAMSPPAPVLAPAAATASAR